MTEFWRERLPEGREAVGWEKVLRLLVVNRLLEPGSEFRVHRHWFVESAMDALLESDFQVAEKDRLCRCLDRVNKSCSYGGNRNGRSCSRPISKCCSTT